MASNGYKGSLATKGGYTMEKKTSSPAKSKSGKPEKYLKK